MTHCQKISAKDRHMLLNLVKDGMFRLETINDKDYRYISQNTKTNTFWAIYISEHGGDVLEARDDLYNLLADIIENEFGYVDLNRGSSLQETVWVFPRHPLYYVKVAIFPWTGELSVVMHYHKQVN